MKLPPFLTPGHRSVIGSHTFTESEILAFAREYDPQPFHTDPDAARHSVFGALCASGYHTASIWMRCQRDHASAMRQQWIDEGNPPFAFGPSPGYEQLIWHKPVFVGDRVTYHNETKTCRPSSSRKGWFVLTGQMGGTNQDGEPVLSFLSSVLVQFPA